MKPAANGLHEREARTRVGPASLLLLLLAAIASVPAEASVPRTAAGDACALRAASLAEPSRLARLTASDDVEHFALLADDDLALSLTPWNAADLALESRGREGSFSLHLGVDVFGREPLRGPPSLNEDLCQGDDECLAGTRIGGLGLLEPFAQKAEPELTLGLLPGYEVSTSGLAYGKPLDPWGLSFWSSIQGYVAGITEEVDPTGLLPEVEAVDAGYHTGSRDAEDFDVSKTAGKWTLRGLTALKAGAQAAGKLGIQAVKNALKSEAKQAATTFAAGVAGDATEQVLLSAGVDEDAARIAGKAGRHVASSALHRAPGLMVDSSSTRRTPDGRLRSGDGRFSYDGGRKRPAGTGTHRNTVDDREATLYEKYDKEGNFLKHGVTFHEDPRKRYTDREIAGGDVVPIERGPRRAIIAKERDRVETAPGPDNHEPWAGRRRGP